MLGEFMVLSLKALGALFGGCGVFLLYISYWYNEKFLIDASVYLGLAAVIAVATNRGRQRIKRR
jgi:hypothetical protein